MHSREQFLFTVKEWSLMMLDILRHTPSTADKLTLLQQVDKMKMMSQIEVDELPAYVAALAFLSSKASCLIKEQPIDFVMTPELAESFIRSDLIRNKFRQSEDANFQTLREFLKLKKPPVKSETLRRLSETGL